MMSSGKFIIIKIYTFSIMRTNLILNGGQVDQMMAGITEKNNNPAMKNTNEANSFYYVISDDKNEEIAVNDSKQDVCCCIKDKELSLLLQSSDWTKLKKYLRTHSLSYCDEYQLITKLVTEVDDTDEVEKIVSCYIKYHGLSSHAAKELLKNLGFDKALKALHVFEKGQKAEEKENQYSDFEKLCDGFKMFQDDDERFFIASYFDEPVAYC